VFHAVEDQFEGCDSLKTIPSGLMQMSDMDTARAGMQAASVAVEVFGVGVIVIGIAAAAVQFLSGLAHRDRQDGLPTEALGEKMKRTVGLTAILGLEILVAADIIRSVAVSPTLATIAALGLLVLVRTFLSWTIALEIDGRWPWQRGSKAESRPSDLLG
jgi:uncharacterized membrane protein